MKGGAVSGNKSVSQFGDNRKAGKFTVKGEPDAHTAGVSNAGHPTIRGYFSRCPAVVQDGRRCARCSRRHSPRSSKIVEAESRASDSAISIAALAMSASAPRFDAVATNAVVGLQ
jgi:hypothetical protein